MTAIADATGNGLPEMAATGDWLEAHADYLFHFALGQTRDAGVAEDLVQETFLAALKSREHFDGRSSDRTWLTGILRHKICDYLRRRCRERKWLADEPPSDRDKGRWDDAVAWIHEVASECMTPARRMELDEFRVSLEHALGQLPARIAQAFRLCEIEELPNREVCAAMQVSENNLWVMLHRARKQLRELLASWSTRGLQNSRPTAGIR